MKSNCRQIGLLWMRPLLKNPRLSSYSRSFSFSSSSTSPVLIVPRHSLYLLHSFRFASSASSTSASLLRSFSSDSSKPTFYDNVHQNFTLEQNSQDDGVGRAPGAITPLSSIDSIERDEFLPPPSSAAPWQGALNPDGDERDCTGRDPPERSKFLLVKHSTLMRLQHAIWIFILVIFFNGLYTEWRIAHAEEKPGLEPPKAKGPGDFIAAVGKWLESFFGYYWTQLNDKVGLGGHSMLLPPQPPDPFGRPVRTVVVNFEKTLVASEWTRDSGWVLSKRPYVNYFLERLMRAGYEVVLFTDMNQFDCENSVQDLDQGQIIRYRLYKDATNIAKFPPHFVKDLNRLGRDLKNVVMIDHQYKTSGVLTPDNCLPISAWTGDLSDKELYALAVLLEKCQKYNVPDMREIVKRYRNNPRENPFVEEEKRAEEQERLLREEEGTFSRKKKDPSKTAQTDSKSGGGLGSALSGLFGRKSS